MAKTLFCFVCKKAIEVKDDRAIAKLCPEHDTPENKEEMIKTPIRQLLGIQDEGLKMLVANTQEMNKADLNDLYTLIKQLQEQIANLPTETTIVKETIAPAPIADKTIVNEYGELI